MFATPVVASAARLQTIGNELDSLAQAQEYTLNGIFATPPDGLSTAQVHGGNYSLHFGETTTAEFSWMEYGFRSSATAASSTVRAYIYLNQVFSAAQEIVTFSNEGPGSDYSLRLNASNQLCMFDSVPTQIGSCTAISTGTWHYVELSTNGASEEIGQLDGVQFAASSAVTGAAISRVYFGCAFSASCKSDIYYDDEAINDSTGSSQTSFPGAGTDVLYQPTGTGDTNTLYTSTPGKGTTTNWNLISVLPLQIVKFVLGTTTAQGTDSYAVNATTTAKAVPAGATINLVQLGVRFVGNSTTNSQFKIQIEQKSAGTMASSSAIAPNSTTVRTNANAVPFNSPLTEYTDPTGAAWTSTTIGTMQIGEGITTANANFDKFYGVWAYVEYVAAATPVAQTMQSIFTNWRGRGIVWGGSWIVK